MNEHERIMAGFTALQQHFRDLHLQTRRPPEPAPTVDQLRQHYAAFNLAFQPKPVMHEAAE